MTQLIQHVYNVCSRKTYVHYSVADLKSLLLNISDNMTSKQSTNLSNVIIAFVKDVTAVTQAFVKMGALQDTSLHVLLERIRSVMVGEGIIKIIKKTTGTTF